MNGAFIEAICTKMPTQGRKITAAWQRQPQMQQQLQDFLNQYGPVLQELSLKQTDLAESYLVMLEDVLNARLEFMRSGSYCCPDFATAQATVYQDRRRMTGYMLGLAVSYFLWPHHFALLSYYKECLAGLPTQPRCLEIGSGHGLFSATLLQQRTDWRALDIVDISPASLAMTQSILRQIVSEQRRDDLSFIQADVTRQESPGGYDWVTMGEVLEHVEDPLRLLQGVRVRLAPGGRLFATTCANSPAVDHVYHFHSIEEIRQLCQRAGLRIVSEWVAPSLDKPLAYMEEHSLDVSYAAVLEEADL